MAGSFACDLDRACFSLDSIQHEVREALVFVTPRHVQICNDKETDQPHLQFLTKRKTSLDYVSALRLYFPPSFSLSAFWKLSCKCSWFA